MTDADTHRVLVPVEILRGQVVPETVIDLFASVPVVLLGYHEIPDQTAPSQARNQFEKKALNELDDLVDAFEARGGKITSRLVFTHDSMKTFERIALELDCDSILLLNPAPKLERMLVPIRGGVNVGHIARLVGTVSASTGVRITLFHVARDEASRIDGSTLLTSASDELEAVGVSPDRIDQSVVVSDDPREEILAVADDYDLVVLGEDRPSIRDMIFGDTAEVVAERAVCPVLVVRRPYLEESAEENEYRT